MNTLLLLLLFLLVSSRTYISYITFLLAMVEIVLLILLLGNYYLSLVYLMIYVGSIAILFIYILMVLSIIEPSAESYLLFLLPFITISILGISIPYYSEISNILTISYQIYSSLIIPIGILLFLAMIFAIRSI
uniref:NADH dehydrogenase subunit 6 n=1 Tax=Amoeboaphelidium protococcarum TaxID=1243177 RepID=UPI002238CCB7|nr:NADH dehydrogenase subunit 6 [Amoeboaphelidium protococcarum]UYP50897.1 NADH dehydrogenase subunit 6 [Amoeboaphelidium protococcarum]UYP50920.1 NADH dehydrogenase subunit 6 [Amoeboaphelidium protococcarum]